jgi:hypothetical protein
MIAPEGCMDSRGFLTVDEYFWDEKWYFPMYGSGIQSVQNYGKMVVYGEETDLITPMQVADNLDAFAEKALEALPTLRAQGGDNIEFPRLECYMGLNDDGRLVLSSGSPENRKGQIWQSNMHRDYLDPQFVTLDDGMLKIYRGTPGNV